MIKKIGRKSFYLLNLSLGRVRDFFENRGWITPVPYKTTCLREVVSYEYPYPLNFREEDKKLFHSEHSYKSYKTTGEGLYEMNEVNVSFEGIVFRAMKTSEKNLPHVVFVNTYGWLYLLGQYIFRKKRKISRDNKYVLIFDHWSKANYYHWIVDSLPRILLAQQNVENPVFLLPANLPGFIKASLEKLEVKNIEYIHENEYLHVPVLYIQEYAAASGHHHDKWLEQIRRIYLGVPDHNKGNKVYVSRGKQKVRRISNEAEVLALMKALDFKIVYFEDHSFSEQIEIMKQASVLVSSHGANLTNMLFMRENAIIFELIRDDKPNFCYWSMSNSLGFNYYYQVCPIAEKDDIYVDTERMRENLKQIGIA